MNGYLAFYNGKQIEVLATSSYAAQTEAARVFKVSSKNQYKVTVALAEVNGEQITHTPTD